MIAKLLELLLLNGMRDLLRDIDACIPHFNQSAYRKGISRSSPHRRLYQGIKQSPSINNY